MELCHVDCPELRFGYDNRVDAQTCRIFAILLSIRIVGFWIGFAQSTTLGALPHFAVIYAVGAAPGNAFLTSVVFVALANALLPRRDG